MAYHDLEAWHDFHVLLGTAGATLEGLMFVAASVGTGVFTEERQVPLRTFLSPTVVAFGGVLFCGLVGLVPMDDARPCALLIGGLGLLGLLYSVRVWQKMRRAGITATVDLEDRLWYALAPALAYALLLLDGAAFAEAARIAPDLLAIGAGLLLLAGLRNAWDITSWMVMRRRG